MSVQFTSDERMNFQNRLCKSLFLTVALLSCSLMQSALGADCDRLQQMILLSNHVNDSAVVEAYRAMSDSERNQPQAMYVLAYSLMRMNRFAEAKPLLDAVANQGFDGYPGWTPVSQFEKRIEAINSFKLPVITTASHDKKILITAYGERSSWNDSIINALPEFRSRAQEIFGELTPPINFYFFSERAPYDEFFTVALGVKPSAMLTENNSMTGSLSTVVCCEKDSKGVVLPIYLDRHVGDVMHEYGHALCNTVFGTRYGFLIPQWFNEGTADNVASPYYQKLFAEHERWLKATSVSIAPPTYQQMCDSLYKDPNMRYAIASLMVRELVRQKGQQIIKQVLLETRDKGDFASAFRHCCDMEPERLFRGIVEQFWNHQGMCCMPKQQN
jgi:hypothetical protein